MSRNWHPQKSLIIERCYCVDVKLDFAAVIWILALCSSTECCLGIPDTTQLGPLCHNLAALLPSIHSPNPIKPVQVLKYLHYRFLNTLRRVGKIAKSDCQLRYGCLSVRVEQRGSHWRLFVKFGYSSFFENSFNHSAVFLTTDPKPPPKRALHIVRSWASSFKWEYPLLSWRSSRIFPRLLPRLPVTSIPPFIFPPITRCRRQFLRKMWPIQLAFRLLISCRIFFCSLTLSLTSSFLTWSVQLIFSILLQHISKLSRCF